MNKQRRKHSIGLLFSQNGRMYVVPDVDEMTKKLTATLRDSRWSGAN